VKWICLAHSDYELRKVPLETHFHGSLIRPRYLTAVFRVADAADLESRRAPLPVYEILKEKLPDRTRRIWKSYQNIRDVSFPREGNSIVVTVTNKRGASFALKEFSEDFESARPVLEDHDFPYSNIRVKIEKRAPYKH